LNAFGILKETFQKLLDKIILHFTMVLDVFAICCLFPLSHTWKKEVDI